MKHFKVSVTSLIVLSILLLAPAICNASFHPAVKILDYGWDGDYLCLNVQNISDTNYRAVQVFAVLSSDDGGITADWNWVNMSFEAGKVITIREYAVFPMREQLTKIRFTGTEVVPSY